MPVISFVSAKGGAGKTTSAIILGTTLAKKHAVTLIDADELMRLNKWAGKSREAIDHIDVVVEHDERGIFGAIERAKKTSEYVIIDTKGEASRLNSFIIGESDLVLVPTGEDIMEMEDAVGSIGDIMLESRALRREIPFSVLFTRVQAGNKSTVARTVNEALRGRFDCIDIELLFLAAFASMYQNGGTVWEMSSKEHPNLLKAQNIAEAYTLNVLAALEVATYNVKEAIIKELKHG